MLAELPVLLPITEVAEALLRTQHGPTFITRMVGNMPDTFYEGVSEMLSYLAYLANIIFIIFSVCYSLIGNGERYEEETYLGRARLETLRSLCRMCPDQILMVRSKCVSSFKLFNRTVESGFVLCQSLTKYLVCT